MAKVPERVLVYCEKEVRDTFLRIWSSVSQGKLTYRDIEYVCAIRFIARPILIICFKALTRIGFALGSREGSRVEFKVPEGCTGTRYVSLLR